MADTFKEFEAMYKKCKPITSGSLKEATKYAKTMKYFRYDMNNALDALEEAVLEEKCSEDPIKASKIEDYCKNKEMKAVLKAVHWNLDKMVEAYKDLDKMENDPGFCKPNVKKLVELQNEIYKAADAKKKRKAGKLDPKTLKLQHQVNDDLEEIMNFWDILKVVDKITSGRRDDPKKEFDARIKAIMKAKPRLSSKAKKYLELAPKMLHKKALQRTVSQCQSAAKAVNEAANKALTAAKKNNSKGLLEGVVTGDKQLLVIEKVVENYTKIQSKYDKQISKSDGKKAIEKAIKNIEKIRDQANKRWDSAKAEISKLTKET